jgi:hypothetical protein
VATLSTLLWLSEQMLNWNDSWYDWHHSGPLVPTSTAAEWPCAHWTSSNFIKRYLFWIQENLSA